MIAVSIQAYLLRRRMILSGVLANEINLLGTCFFASAATLFSDAGGIFVAPPEGAPGCPAGSDMFNGFLVVRSDGDRDVEMKEKCPATR